MEENATELLKQLADLMSKLSGEEVEYTNICALPLNDVCEAYVARTANYTYLAHCYPDGKTLIFIH